MSFLDFSVDNDYEGEFTFSRSTAANNRQSISLDMTDGLGASSSSSSSSSSSAASSTFSAIAPSSTVHSNSGSQSSMRDDTTAETSDAKGAIVSKFVQSKMSGTNSENNVFALL